MTTQATQAEVAPVVEGDPYELPEVKALIAAYARLLIEVGLKKQAAEQAAKSKESAS